MQCLNTGGRKGRKNHKDNKKQTRGRPGVVDVVFTSGREEGPHIGLVLPLHLARPISLTLSQTSNKRHCIVVCVRHKSCGDLTPGNVFSACEFPGYLYRNHSWGRE